MYIYCLLLTKCLKSEPTVPLLKVVPTLCHSITFLVRLLHNSIIRIFKIDGLIH